MAIKILTDTSCDLPDEILEQYQIDMIPLRVTFADGETYLDRWELSPELFVKKMAASKTLPKTAAPDPSTFIEHILKKDYVRLEKCCSSACLLALAVHTRLPSWHGKC